ncbi:MAG: SDR family oxidoreductase [Spirochaetaceae bacterium]|nr:SDR family oxidoreductase [Myxococcales bacterium]MCB9723077.1 SDR family oxidoreductase [Spirochaetaceae bacterium]HPG24149.1 SDR family oxidoreductase [Myxococcota bacterium]
MGLLAGKTALVTGGSRGIGRKIVDRLIDSGALVAFNYASNHAAAKEAVAEIEARGGEAFAIQAELGRDGSIESLVEALEAGLRERRGDPGLDILVNNVGGGSPARIAETTGEFLDQTYAVNLRAPFLLTRALMPHLRDGGRVVNISSATVRVGFEDAAAYVCCKAALDTFSHLLAKELGGRGITANSIAVGRTAGETNAEFFSDPARVAQIADVTALRRVGTEDDVAGVVHAVISPDAGWITGQVIDATGGFKI